MENNKLQDPFFQKVFKPIVARVRKKLNISLHIKPDEDKKTDKATRIESNLEPLDTDGELIFNEDEKDNPHMQELISQFKLFESNLPYPADGPDCIEGGNRIIDKKLRDVEPEVMVSRKALRSNNKNRL
jgi:hypothetical protein